MRLLTMDMPAIHEEVRKMDKESKALRKELYKLSWFMRGALSIEQAFSMDIADREILGDIIKENLETTKESGLPFF
jgi:hypothetical protein